VLNEADEGRFRVNIHHQRGTLAASIRLLPSKIPSLESLHLPPTLAKLAERRQGLVLVTGPTGCGKSSTLAALIDIVNTRRAAHVVTIEDPVEYQHANRSAVIEQIEVGRDTPDFAVTLRSIMRQTPDVILVGEMRDAETIATALTAAETGHLVLSTLHTNDAPGAVARLIEMGVEPFLVASAVDCVVAQRLARRLCEACKKPVVVEGHIVREHGFDVDDHEVHVFEPGGCARCGGTGYKGRVGLYEVLEINDPVRELIMMGANSVELRKKAVDEGMLTLRMSGLEKIKQGITTLEEVLRETVF
jgi:type II secretory ATPase GspE/PulE/Tfp pilus assembly ATPase PilB-like protein